MLAGAAQLLAQPTRLGRAQRDLDVPTLDEIRVDCLLGENRADLEAMVDVSLALLDGALA